MDLIALAKWSKDSAVSDRCLGDHGNSQSSQSVSQDGFDQPWIAAVDKLSQYDGARAFKTAASQHLGQIVIESIGNLVDLFQKNHPVGTNELVIGSA